MDPDERAALLADFARQNDRLSELNALATQDDLTPQERSAMMHERLQVHTRIAQIRTQLGRDTTSTRLIAREAAADARRAARATLAAEAVAAARASRIQSDQAAAEARRENRRVDAVLHNMALQRAERESRARDENIRVATRASQRNSTSRADEVIAALDRILTGARDVYADIDPRADVDIDNMHAFREAYVADRAYTAHANELQRRSRTGNDRGPPADADPARGAELAWRNGIVNRRHPPASTQPHRFERAFDPEQAARFALRAWAAAASREDEERNPVPPIIPPGQDCCVCLSMPKSVLFLPCGHAACCALCWNKMLGSTFSPQCPLCRTPVEKAERLSPAQLQDISTGAEIPHADIRRPDNKFIRLGASLH